MEICKKADCTGCRACEQVCPQKCIFMQMDQEGFFYPFIEETICISCEKCKRVCPNNKENMNVNSYMRKSYVVKNRNEKIRLKSSSGGLFFSLAQYALEKNGVVYGAVYDDFFSVYHVGAVNEFDVKKMMGSKYIQSDTKNTFAEVKKYLEEERYVLYTGTPCQISAINSYLNKKYENLLLVSVICHGVGSPEVWQRYLEYQKGLYYIKNINDIRFRDKHYGGWGVPNLVIETSSQNIVRYAFDDLYYEAFLRAMILRPSCYQCKHKGDANVADLVIGDFWGVEYHYPELDDRKGISIAVVQTKKGELALKTIKEELDIREVDYQVILEGNPRLQSSVQKHKNRSKFFQELKKTNRIDISLKNALSITPCKEERNLYLYPIIAEYLNRKIEGNSISNVLNFRKVKKIALYAIAELTPYFYKDIINSNSNIQITCIADKSILRQKENFMNYQVESVDVLLQKYKNKEVDLIVICSVFYTNEIFDELENIGIKLQHIISPIELIYAMKNV